MSIWTLRLRTVLVVQSEGRVGKSSIVAVGGMLARPQRRVPIVDADQQGNVTRSELGVDGDRGQSLAMALQYTQPLAPCADVRLGLASCRVVRTWPPSARWLPPHRAPGWTSRRTWRRPWLICARSEPYALVLIDSGPGDAPMLDALLDTARYLLVPSCDDDASLEGGVVVTGGHQ